MPGARRSVASARRRTTVTPPLYTYDFAGTGAWVGWTTAEGTVDLQSGKGRMQTAAVANAKAKAYFNTALPQDYDLTVKPTIATVTSTEFYAAVCVRAGSTNFTQMQQHSSWYCQFNGTATSGFTTLYRISAAGVATFLVGGPDKDFVQGDVLNMLFSPLGSHFRVKYWRNADAVPSGWDIDFNDGVNAPTGTGLSFGVGNGGNATFDRWDWDDITITVPGAAGPATGTLAKTLANTTATASGTVGSTPSTTAFHWGFMVTQDGLTESTGSTPPTTPHITALHSTAARDGFRSVPNAIFQCAKDHFGVFPHDYQSGVTNDWTAAAQGFSGKGLDNAVALIDTFRGDASSKLMIQFYGIPGWQGGLPGNNFTSLAPDTIAHEDDYAAACARIALRYNGTGGQPNVEYFAFWNEMKGMDSYTPVARAKAIRMYNKVWTAVKAVRPTAKIGGIYSKFISWEAGMSRGDGSSLYGLSLNHLGGSVDFRVLDLYYEFKRDCLYDFVSIDVWAGNDHCTGKQAFGPPNFTGDSDSVAPGLTAYQQMKSMIPACFAWTRGMFPTVPIICNEFYPQARLSNYTLGRGAGDSWTETTVENWVIECLNDIKPYGPGWICAWGEKAEPPNPFNYETTGTPTTLISKLIAYEASL